MQHWNRDPKTGDYVMSGGAPEQTDSLLPPAYMRLKSKRRQWLYAPDTRWGSDFYTVQKNRTASDGSLFENLGARALAPMVEDGRAEEIEVTVPQRTRYGVGLQIKIKESESRQEEFTVNPIE